MNNTWSSAYKTQRPGVWEATERRWKEAYHGVLWEGTMKEETGFLTWQRVRKYILCTWGQVGGWVFGGFPDSSVSKEPTCNTRDPSLIPGSGRSAEEEIGYPLQYSWPSSNNTREDSTHGHHQMVKTEIRLIIFFAAKDGEALYSQQKQDRELTVAQIMKSLLPNSDWFWRKWGKPLDDSGMT